MRFGRERKCWLWRPKRWRRALRKNWRAKPAARRLHQPAPQPLRAVWSPVARADPHACRSAIRSAVTAGSRVAYRASSWGGHLVRFLDDSARTWGGRRAALGTLGGDTGGRALGTAFRA